jgi:low affinity Fe/Cu permease
MDSIARESSRASVPRDIFGELAAWTTRATGGRWGFLGATALVVAWAASGPYFRFSEMWQLVINTGTTIVTFLMVFLIQNAQNRESRAVHLKLDELILALKGAKNDLLDVEDLTEAQLEAITRRYRAIAGECRSGLEEAVAEVGEDIDELGCKVDAVGHGPAW